MTTTPQPHSRISLDAEFIGAGDEVVDTTPELIAGEPRHDARAVPDGCAVGRRSRGARRMTRPTLEDLRDAEAAARAASARATEAIRERDRMILAALDRELPGRPLRQREVAAATGLSLGRIGQLATSRR